jgi:1-acyl-sn-glycerol-3-phosphate acyltransferase
MTAVAWGISKFILWIFFSARYGLRVTGQEHVPKRGPFILASNHLSFLDPPLVGMASPRRVSFLARKDLFKGLLGAYLRAVGVMPVARGEADIGAIREALEKLRRGQGVAIFPEGTRQLSGTLGTAKRGVGMLAEMAKAPIVPVLVQGTYEALPPDSKSLRPAKIRVAFGPLISYTMATSPTGTPSGIPEGSPNVSQAGRVRHEAIAAVVTQAWRKLEAQLNVANPNGGA